MNRFVEVDEFQKDLKKFKFNISADLNTFKKALKTEPTTLSGTVAINNLGEGIYPIYKARKFRCRSLNRGSKSGIRIIYTYNPQIEEIILIEIYHKNRKTNYDLNRVKKYTIYKNEKF